MSANITSGNNQRYETPGLDIFTGLKPDVVCLQEFNYASPNGLGTDTPAAIREMVDTAFGASFSYFRETDSDYSIPNGIISRYPIVASGSKRDEVLAGQNRGFAWAKIELPGTNFLYAVSVHLYSGGSSTDRNNEALAVQSLVQTNFPPGAWVVVCGDFNTDNRNEAAVTTFKTFLSDSPIPTDLNGNPNSNRPRNKPFDYVLPSFALTNRLIPVVLPSHTLPNGLVFISTNYTPLTDVVPVQFSDSDAANMQHMAVIKDFSIPVGAATNPPAITAQPQGQTNAVGSTVSFSVTATGSGSLGYQWRFSGTNISGAVTNPYSLANAQLTNSGNYSVVVTNAFGSITSSVVALLLTNAAPAITTQPQSQTVNLGDNAAFSVTASGTPPLIYQWRFGGTNISGATTNPFLVAGVQLTNAGSYSVIVSNFVGSVTSSAAQLSVFSTQSVVIAQWNFNSVPPDANAATGTSAPSVGSGTASLVGGATAMFATGDTSFDPAGSTDNSGWNTATYPAQGTGNKTRGLQFNVSTVGKQNIIIGWSSESPSTGSRYGRLQYSTNGADFIDYPSAFINGTSYTSKTNSLAFVSAVNNNANFAFRLMAEFESTATGSANSNYDAGDITKSYGTAGSMRYDMVTVSGVPAIPPTAAVLNSPVLSGGQVGFSITGSAGASYVVQTSTNLGSTNWLPVYTNVSPFNFSDTNLGGAQKFYRAISP